MTRKTFCVMVTPPGRGAVASVLVDGPRAAEFADRFFRSAGGKPLSGYALDRIAFGRWDFGPGEELVACRRSEHRVEIHCHGGQAAVGALLESLASAGCQTVSWTEWLANQPEDRIQSQAALALAHAPTERTAAILLDQFSGALGSAIHEVLRLLELSDANSVAAARTSLDALQSRGRLGRHLTEPFRIALAGRPNVGKSSLINALVGYRRSIVSDQPGTTRDIVTAATALAGWPVEIADTAGLRTTDDSLEHAGVRRAEQTLRDADSRVLVFDASARWSGDDQALVDAWPDALAVHNKIDLPRAAGPVRPAGIDASTITMAGIDTLADSLISRLAPNPPPPGAPMPFHASHFEAIADAVKCLSRGDLPGASAALRSLL
jgi:tRNA modification GTPase